MLKKYFVMNSHSEIKHKVILDTSILMYSVNLKLDLVIEIKELLEGAQKLIVPSMVIDELRSIASHLGKRGSEAKITLKLVEELLSKGTFHMLDVKADNINDIDRLLLNLCERMGAYLATADLRLKKKAIKRGIKVIYPRKSKRKLMIS